MPTELEELVEFLHHGNTQIRQIAAENLVGYSTSQPQLFKRNQLEPIKDLKLLIKDYPPIAKNAVTMLVNLSTDSEVLESLWSDEGWIESLLRRVTNAEETNANLLCMLLANMSKSRPVMDLATLERENPEKLSTSKLAMIQLIDCFAKGSNGGYNKHADYDYLSYVFEDLAMHVYARQVLISPYKTLEGAEVLPLSQLMVFTEHASAVRRRGVAGTIKNACFDVISHEKLLAPTDKDGVGLLAYVLLPLMGNEDYDDEDTEGMLDECQLLPPDKTREPDTEIICTHLETLLLLTTTKQGRDRLREVKVYPIVRELHMHVEDQKVRDGCDRLVQMLMRGEEGDPIPEPPRQELHAEDEEDDEDDQIIEVL